MTHPLPPAGEPLVIHCPSCEKPVLAHAAGRVVQPETDDGPAELITLVQCSLCAKAMLAAQGAFHDGWTDPIRLYPPQGAELSWHIPHQLISEHAEARRCFEAHAYTAAVVMVRRTLEGVCIEQGVTKKQPLIKSLEDLAKEGKLDDRLMKWAQELRVLGNQGAHYTGKSVWRDDARDALLFSEALLEYMYTLPTQFEQFRQRRTKAANEK